MMSFNRDSYSSSDAWLEELRKDYLWHTKRTEMDEAFATSSASASTKYTQQALSLMGNGLVSCYWNLAPYKTHEIVRDIWEEHSLSLIKLKPQAVAMLMLEYIEQRSHDVRPLRSEGDAISRQSAMRPYIARQESADLLIRWMHDAIDTRPTPKLKLMVVHALHKGCFFTSRIPHEIYCLEFGAISKSSYSEWMSEDANYDQKDIDTLLEHLPDVLK